MNDISCIPEARGWRHQKAIEDLGDIARLIEAHPYLVPSLPADVSQSLSRRCKASLPRAVGCLKPVGVRHALPLVEHEDAARLLSMRR